MVHSYSSRPRRIRPYRALALARRLDYLEAAFGELEDLVTLYRLASEGVEVREAEEGAK